MKLLELAAKPDDKAIYRQVALAVNEGQHKTPPLSAPLQLWEPGGPEPSKEVAEKMVGKIRSGLASVDMGRFTVERIGPLAWVSVNARPVRTRTKRVAKAAGQPAVKTAAAARKV